MCYVGQLANNKTTELVNYTFILPFPCIKQFAWIITLCFAVDGHWLSVLKSDISNRIVGLRQGML